ncbi:hypothetical protein ACIHCM_06465 [Streptomyces sp. NPDC052023]|uniref:hypothetical protein n=1 Tax=Streptomyces sp. NPDC052023 TaxID=3365681 RepID=UPI0037CEAA1B
MTEVRDDAATGRDQARSRAWRGIFAAVAAVPVLILGVLVVGVPAFLLTDDEEVGRHVAEKADCAEAPAFGGAALPEGARTESCTVTHGTDPGYRAVFRMPRADVRGWLAGSYPDAPEPRRACASSDADLCLGLRRSDALPGDARAHGVQVEIAHQDAGTALVSFSAFTICPGCQHGPPRSSPAGG